MVYTHYIYSNQMKNRLYNYLFCSHFQYRFQFHFNRFRPWRFLIHNHILLCFQLLHWVWLHFYIYGILYRRFNCIFRSWGWDWLHNDLLRFNLLQNVVFLCSYNYRIRLVILRCLLRLCRNSICRNLLGGSGYNFLFLVRRLYHCLLFCLGEGWLNSHRRLCWGWFLLLLLIVRIRYI